MYESVEEITEAVIERYPKLCKLHPCSFVMFSDDLKYQESCLLAICHANMHQIVLPGKVDQMITSFNVKTDLDLRFFDFMKNVLYKDYRQFLHLEKLKDSYYFRMSRLDLIPANVAFNIAICSRFILEWPKFLKMWDKFVIAGVPQGLAFALCITEKGNPNRDLLDWEFCPTIQAYEHFPFYTTASISRLANCSLTTSVGNFKNNPNKSVPCSEIWGNDSSFKKITGKTIKEICEMCNA